MRATSLYFDSDPAVLAGVRGLDPAARVMVRLTTDMPLAELLTSVGAAQVVHADLESLSPGARAEIARLGLRVWLNSLGDADQRLLAGDPAGIKDLRDLGASILQTDAIPELAALRR